MEKTESPVKHLFQGWFEVTPGDRSPADQLPNLTEDRGGGGQNVRATFLVRLLAGAVTARLMPPQAWQHGKRLPPWSAPTSIRLEPACEQSARERNKGSRSDKKEEHEADDKRKQRTATKTDEDKRTTATTKLNFITQRGTSRRCTPDLRKAANQIRSIIVSFLFLFAFIFWSSKSCNMHVYPKLT